MPHTSRLNARSISFLCLLLVTGLAHADIHRCTVNGKTVYTDEPCINARSIDTTNATPPTAEDQARATQRAKAVKQQLDEIETRREKEAEIARLKHERATKEAKELRKRCRRLERRLKEAVSKADKQPTEHNVGRVQDAREDYNEQCP